MSLATIDFDYLRTLVKDHTAIVIDPGKEYLAETRLAPLVTEHGCSSVQELLSTLRRQAFNGLHRKVLDAMTNNETWFFRDCNCFGAFTGTILPELIRRRATERQWRPDHRQGRDQSQHGQRQGCSQEGYGREIG